MTSELSLVATGKGSNIMCGDQSDHVLQHWTVDISIDEHEWIDSGEGTAALAGKGIGGCWPGKAQSGRPQRPRDRR